LASAYPEPCPDGGFAHSCAAEIAASLKTTLSLGLKFAIHQATVIEQKLISFASVDFIADRHRFDTEAKASRANKFAC
jgi:hypothetical protein